MKIRIGFQKYTIKEISIEIKTGKTPPSTEDVYYRNGNINWYTPVDIGGTSILDSASKKITQTAINKRVAFVFKANTVLITCIGEIGRVGIIQNPSSANQQITGILVNEKIISHKYFYYWLIRNQNLMKHYSNYAVIPILNNRILEKIPIYLPSLEIQNKTVSQLDLIQSLIDKRRQSIHFLSKLVENTFLDMFGDPINNQHRWAKEKLENLVSEDCNLSYGIIKADGVEVGVPIVRPVDLNTLGELDASKLKKVDKNISKQYKRTILQGNEILLCVRGNVGLLKQANKSLINANVSRGIVPIRLNKRINNGYFFTLLKMKSMQSKLKSLSRGIALQQLNIRDLRMLKIIVPDKNTKEFELIYESSIKQKISFEYSLEKLETFFKSLLQDVFNEKEVINEKMLFEHLVKTFSIKDFLNNKKRISYLIEFLNDNKFIDYEIYIIARDIAFELLQENIITQILKEETGIIELHIS